jgi:hypothetical protein
MAARCLTLAKTGGDRPPNGNPTSTAAPYCAAQDANPQHLAIVDLRLFDADFLLRVSIKFRTAQGRHAMLSEQHGSFCGSADA